MQNKNLMTKCGSVSRYNHIQHPFESFYGSQIATSITNLQPYILAVSVPVIFILFKHKSRKELATGKGLLVGIYYLMLQVLKNVMRMYLLCSCSSNPSLSQFLCIWWKLVSCTAQKLKFSIKYFFSKCDQIRRNQWTWSHLLKKSLMENFIFCSLSVLIS